MALACREVAERHPVAAADLRIKLMHSARVAARRQPLRQCVWLEERAIDFIRPGGQNAVQTNSVGHDNFSLALPIRTQLVLRAVARGACLMLRPRFSFCANL